MTATVGASSAIEAIRRRQAVRVYGETSGLKLLGVEDKYAARIAWKTAHGKAILPTETSALESARKEIERRTATEMDEARAEFARRNKIWSYFPDEGPLRRELYPNHMKFVGYTKTDDEVMMLAANRCITPWTPLQTDHGERLALEMLGETGFDVRSWDGNSRCTKPASPIFLKGIEPAFQIHLSNGEHFDCTLRHRILSARSGWISLGKLLRASYGVCYLRRGQGYPANYANGSGLRDARLLQRSTDGEAAPPSQGGARERTRTLSPVGASEQKREYSRESRAFDRSRPQGEADLLSFLCGEFEDPNASFGYELSNSLHRGLQRHALEYSQSPLIHEEEYRQSFSGDRFRGQRHRQREASDRLNQPALIGGLQFAFALDPGAQDFLIREAGERTATFVPLWHPPLSTSVSIVSISRIGEQPIIDFTVPETHCYESAGLIHHNSGKTQLGALCVAHWAMGRYPHWWDGRVFDGPVSEWICNKTAKDVRDINEAELLGPPGNEQDRGTGMIPAHLIQKVTPKPGTPHAFEFIAVEHVSGATSYIGSKSYDQGREAFQGRAEHAIWNDEEVPKDVADEQRLRIMTLSGLIIFSYTPINGLTEMTMGFMESAGMDINQMRQAADSCEG